MAQVLPPDEERANIYKTKNFTEVRVLLPGHWTLVLLTILG